MAIYLEKVILTLGDLDLMFDNFCFDDYVKNGKIRDIDVLCDEFCLTINDTIKFLWAVSSRRDREIANLYKSHRVKVINDTINSGKITFIKESSND